MAPNCAMPERLPAFQATQREFAAYIRDPQRNAPPADVKPERMRMYRELFYNNVSSFLENGFPVLHSLLDDATWEALVGDFFARHRCHTPLFTGIPEEFLDYLQNEREASPSDPPFMLELAHYEWVELALSIAEAEAPGPNIDLEADPLAQTLVLSPLAWPLAYQFPVQRISRGFQPPTPTQTPTCLVVYRDREDQVHFLETNPVTHRLLLILRDQGPIPAMDCLSLIASELGHTDPAPLLPHGAELLRDLLQRSVVGSV
ncbi:MAG: hypothetical protein H6R26_1866 [Proteobacteria bacterium]|nr:hypothetical protein [Pseudomonadota bacterium]